MKVLAVTGRSGGHIFPALSFIEELKDEYKDTDILLVLPRKSVKAGIIPAVCRIEFTSITNIGFSFGIKNIGSVLNFIKGSLESFYLLLSFKPDIVIGFGSINSAPFLFLAWLMRIKTIIHEQNVIPGRANRLLSKFVDKVAVSFEQTRDYLGISPDRAVFTGNPIRKELKKSERHEALNFFGFKEDKFTLLVMGGSQGSERVNGCLLKALSRIADNQRLQVIHLAGTGDTDSLNKAYKEAGLAVRLFAFLDKMQYAYSIADLAVTRAGASSISELINFRIPSIIIPYPFAYEHQKANASVLDDSGCAVVIDDAKLSTEGLKQIIGSFIIDSGKLDSMRLNYAKFLRGNAASLLVNSVLSLASS